MQWFRPAKQVHGRNKTDQTVEMIPMQMADKYMFYPLKVNMHPPERHLSAFAAIEQEEFIAVTEQL